MPSSGCNNNNRGRIFYPIKDSETFNYKIKLVGNLPTGNNEAVLEDVKIFVLLKNLSNFMFNLDILLINAEIELTLKWSQNCILTERAHRDAIAECDDPATEPAVNAINTPSDLKFNITDCKLYVPVVTLQSEYENKLYEELKTGITIDFTWSKYRTQIINQIATNNLNYLIDPTLNNVNRLFVLAFPNEEGRSSFSKYYMLTVEIKDYNVILDGQTPFYEISIRNKEETYKAIIELIEKDTLTTGSFNYEYFFTHYKLIAINLSRQKTDFKNQQINFIGRLEEDATILFIIEEKHTTGLEFLQNSLSIV